MRVVNSFNTELGYELISVIPYAYYLSVNNQLEKTISAPLSEPFYYFSPKHEINTATRSDAGMHKLIRNRVPNAWIHKPVLDTSQFLPPPYKEYFANDIYKWEKPTICICNKYNNEWHRPPLNFFSLEILEEMFILLKDRFQIIYLGVDLWGELQDDAPNLYLGDIELCKKYEEVIVFQDLLKETTLNWNELQLRIYANCNKFITVIGGYSVLASYFGGINIIYCKWAFEVEPQYNDFGYYHVFGNSDIRVVRNYEALVNEIKVL